MDPCEISPALLLQSRRGASLANQRGCSFVDDPPPDDEDEEELVELELDDIEMLGAE